MYRNHHANFEQNVIMDFRDIYDNRMQRCQQQLGQTRHGHVWGEISRKVDFSFL